MICKFYKVYNILFIQVSSCGPVKMLATFTNLLYYQAEPATLLPAGHLLYYVTVIAPQHLSISDQS